MLGDSFFFFFAYVVVAGARNDEAPIKDNKNHFIPRGAIKNYNVLIDGTNFYDQAINDLIKQYLEVRQVSTGYDNDYATGSWLSYAYFKDNYKLTAFELSKQKSLDSASRAI